MRKIILFYVTVGVFCLTTITTFVSRVQAGDDSCDCPKLTCNEECEVQTDLTFYSEKCAGGSRVKSCSKPTCVKLDNAPAKCGFASLNAGSTNARADKNGTPVPVREIASVRELGEVVGRVKFTEGSVKRVINVNKKDDLNVGDEVHQQERIETDSTGKAQILFNNGNILNLTPNTEIIISEATETSAKSENKKMVLDLLKGRVRNQVKQKYDGTQSYYRVRTGAAVAGVRGTDFVVSLVEDAKEVSAKIETVEGEVELSDQSLKEKISVAHGETASYTADREAIQNMMAARDVSSEVKVKGRFTPVTKLTEQQLAALESETNYSLLEESEGGKTVAGRRVKKIKDAICAKPVGALNQCAWSCENNPAGEKRCRTDLPNVSCVRRVCNANGEWSQPTRLPAAYKEACAASEPVVKACDY